MSFTRITVRGDQMGGVPCIRGLRIPVATVVRLLADGMNDPEILDAYPDLEAEDIREAMGYAARAGRERDLPLVACAWGCWSAPRSRRSSPSAWKPPDTTPRTCATTD